MKIAIFGAGYVGLVVGTCLAESGNDVTLVDVDGERVAALREGRLPIFEPGLRGLLLRNVAEERLRFTLNGPEAVRQGEVIFIAVGTPMGEDGQADLKYVMQVARTVGENLNGYKVVVDKSTVPVGTAEKVRAEIARHGDGPFDVVSNPEFLKEGAALSDFQKPDRVVIGTDSERAKSIMLDLYASFVRTASPILVMDLRSAELTKYACNAMLATRISFMNEMAALCDTLGANVAHVRKGMGTDSRIGFPFLFPGPGYGGSCFPKDLQALMKTGSDAGSSMRILSAVEEVNASQKRRLAQKVVARLGDDLSGKAVALWGLAFKANTDDMREAPALVVIEELLAKGAAVRVHDPEALQNAKRILGERVLYFEHSYEALQNADALVVVTEWSEYRHPDFQRIKQLLRQPVIIDGRNIFVREQIEKMGFYYDGIGV